MHRKNTGFTLVELMIVVAIIGVLAALAIYGVRRYLASAKTAEARNNIGAAARGAVSHFYEDAPPAELLAEGDLSQNPNLLLGFRLCLAVQCPDVPLSVPAGTKYQPMSSPGADFDGLCWQECMRFNTTQPIHYQYQFNAGGNYISVALGNQDPTPWGWEVAAVGDLDGDGQQSVFAITATANTQTFELKTSTQVYVDNEYE